MPAKTTPDAREGSLGRASTSCLCRLRSRYIRPQLIISLESSSWARARADIVEAGGECVLGPRVATRTRTVGLLEASAHPDQTLRAGDMRGAQRWACRIIGARSWAPSTRHTLRKLVRGADAYLGAARADARNRSWPAKHLASPGHPREVLRCLKRICGVIGGVALVSWCDTRAARPSEVFWLCFVEGVTGIGDRLAFLRGQYRLTRRSTRRRPFWS